MPAQKQYFGLLTYPGLAGITARELKHQTGAGATAHRLANHDLLTAKLGPAGYARLSRMKTCEDVFCLLGPAAPVSSRKHVPALRRHVTREAILGALAIKNKAFGRPRRLSHAFNCFVKQDRDGPVRRKDIADEINAGIKAAFPRWHRADPAPLEVWGFYVINRLFAGLRLSDESLRYRGKEPPKRRGALRPVVAAAMAFLADIKKNELVVDPMCGTATLLCEAIAACPTARCEGGDSDARAVDHARRRCAGQNIKIRRWDARDLPCPAQSIDCIVCNLPFGKKYSSPKKNRILYPLLLDSWAQKLKPGGRLVLLTADEHALERALQNNQNLIFAEKVRMKLLGLRACIFSIKRK
jgi:precorrin-6B methylase 2